MNLEQRRLIDQLLVSEEPCLGAVLCSYTFDPAYFEDHVLRALLRLRGDPDEDGARYHEEARAALQQTPVACFIDASVRRGGRRLPYDLLLVRERTFHPKVVLVLYESEARLALGSGNATKPGLEQNTELFFVRRLRYDDPAGAALLRDVDEFLASCASLATSAGTQLALVRQALTARIQNTRPLRDGERTDALFASSFDGRLVDILGERLPADARITRIGVLAPFFEQDDLAAGDDPGGLPSALGALLALRSAKGATLDIGVPWDDAPLGPPPWAEPPALDAHLGELWAHRYEAPGEDGPIHRIAHFIIDRVTAKRVEARNAAGEPCRLDRAALEASIADGRLWPVARPTVHAPKRILARLAAERAVRLWLHPAANLTPSGRASRRPLHAKLFLVTVTQRGRVSTYALAGSANASRAALLRSVADNGNVEAGVLCRFDGEVTLRDFLPSLVECSLDRVTFEERHAPPAAIDLSAWIDDVVHDAATRTLTITWRDTGPGELGRWSLHYVGRELARGDGPPAVPTVIGAFDLLAASAEVIFAAGGARWSIPICVADLATLPTSPGIPPLSLAEMLAILGRHVSAERLATIRAARGLAGVTTALEAVFGEGYGPTNIFRAWWGMTENLSSAPTVSAFRHCLFGPVGARTVWGYLRDEPRDKIGDDEVWIYGCELLRQLHLVQIPESPDLPAKRALLNEVIAGVRADLTKLTPEAESRPWLAAVSRFYGLGGRNGST